MTEEYLEEERIDTKELLKVIDIRRLVTNDENILGSDAPVMQRCFVHKDDKPSLAVYRNGIYCFGCGFFKGAYWFIAYKNGLNINREYGQVLEIAQSLYTGEYIEPENVVEAITEPVSEVAVNYYHNNLLNTYKDRLKYLEKRCISSDVVTKEKIGHTGTAFSIPVWDEKRETVLTLRFRNDDTLNPITTMKYWGLKGKNNCFIYNASDIGKAKEQDRSIVCCEGEFDSLVLSSHDILAFSFTNGNSAFKKLNQFSDLLQGLKEIIIAYDQDKASFQKARDLSQALKKLDIPTKIVRWSLVKDGKDVSDIVKNYGIFYFKELLKEAISVK